MNSLLIIFLFLQFSCSQRIQYGIDQSSKFIPKLKNKRVGILANHTSKNNKNEHLFDILKKANIDIQAIFAPEHGFLGKRSAGALIEDDLSNKIFSLYGKNKKAKAEQMKLIDILIYDIQDVGTRYYTYISTLGYAMQAAAESNTKLIILDRPVLRSGTSVEGAILDTAYSSFVGLYPIPVSYGMSIGELAKMIKMESWLPNLQNLDMEIIKLKNWDRSGVALDDSRFIPPSPNIPNIETIYFYAGLCFLEGTNISEGRGTHQAFRQIGAPWFQPKRFMKYMKSLAPFPVRMEAINFIPKTIKGKAYKPKYEKQSCRGIQLSMTSKENFNAFQFGIYSIHALFKTHPDHFKIDRKTHFTRLLGRKIDEATFKQRSSVDSLLQVFQTEAERFKEKRQKYLLY